MGNSSWVDLKLTYLNLGDVGRKNSDQKTRERVRTQVLIYLNMKHQKGGVDYTIIKTTTNKLNVERLYLLIDTPFPIS